MAKGRKHILDDRDTRVNVFVLPITRPGQRAVFNDDEIERIRSRCADADQASRQFLQFTAAVVGLMLVLTVVATFISPTVQEVLTSGVLLAIAIGVFWHGRTRRIPLVPQTELTRQLLIESRCASCAYKLDWKWAESDGCTLCPECGAAWRLPQPATTSPPHTTTSTGLPPNS